MARQMWLCLSIYLFITACGETDSRATQPVSVVPTESPPRVVQRTLPSAELLQRGARLFQQHCAVCHGKHAEGAPNWHRRDTHGKYPPPPLNGSGHAWHHPQAQLMDMIKLGSERNGGGMPAWQGKLSDAQIEEIIFWFQSRWPDELYEAWYRLDQEDRARRSESPPR